MGDRQVELGYDDGNDSGGFLQEVFRGGVGDEGLPVAEVSILGCGGGFGPFAKEFFIIVDCNGRVNWGRGPHNMVEQDLGLGHGSGWKA